MEPRFKVLFLSEAEKFIERLPKSSKQKVLYNIWKSRYTQDVGLFKKLNQEIWEFRTIHKKIQYRLLAFWYREKEPLPKIIVTHGIVKKVSKVPRKEILKAELLRAKFLANEVKR